MMQRPHKRHDKLPIDSVVWSPTGKPVAPLSFADSLRERRDLVVRHPDHNRIHPRLKPWLSAVGVKYRYHIPILSQHSFFTGKLRIEIQLCHTEPK
jgi:hypothetical protein